MADIRLKELVDVDSLQTIQDYYSRLTGIASIITDENGIPITKESNFTDFCYKLTRQTKEGLRRCEECDARGAELTAESGKAVVYKCHAGLYDFAAPIKVDNQIVGSFVAGQVATVPLSEEMIRDYAFDLHINPDIYAEAAKKVHVISQEQIVSAADFIFVLANILSEMAYKNFQNKRSMTNMQNQLRMRSEMIGELSLSMGKSLANLKDLLEDVKEQVGDTSVNAKLDEAIELSQMMNDSLVVTEQFLNDGENQEELAETQYNLKRLCDSIMIAVTGKLENTNSTMALKIHDEVPNNLYGDVTRIRQLITQLIDSILGYVGTSDLVLEISCTKTAYGLTLNFLITNNSHQVEEEELKEIAKLLDPDNKEKHPENKVEMSFAMPIKLLRSVYGQAEVVNNRNGGTCMMITIPQIEY